MDTPDDDELRQNTCLRAELQSLRHAHHTLEGKYRESEEKAVSLQRELEDAQEKNIELAMTVEELTIQRHCFVSELIAVQDNLLRGLEVLAMIKECLVKVSEGLGEKEVEHGHGVDHACVGRKEFEEWKGLKDFLEALQLVLRMAERVEEKLSDYQEKEAELVKEIEAYKGSNKGLDECFNRGLEVLGLVEESLVRVREGFYENKVEIEDEEMKEAVSDFEGELEGFKEAKSFFKKFDFVTRMVKKFEDKLIAYEEKVKKDKRELKNSVVSLTEENRDVNALLRIALFEKETVEKSLNKLKGDNEQRRVPLLHFAERGLRVGFGFIMGGAATEQYEQQKKDAESTSDDMASSLSAVSDAGSDCEEEVITLASAVEKMMKNLRVEITQLRKALEDSRLATEHLQSLTQKQAQQITEQTVYITELEDRERILIQNVEELLSEMKSTEEDIQRWREACELEVEAGKRVVQERDEVVAILKQELEKTRAALQVSNKKLKLKEELAVAAMAAQCAAERSLQLADSRAAEFHGRIEVLTKQLEAESREKNNRSKARRICWPWQALKMANPNGASTRHMLPEMQALLHID